MSLSTPIYVPSRRVVLWADETSIITVGQGSILLTADNRVGILLVFCPYNLLAIIKFIIFPNNL